VVTESVKKPLRFVYAIVYCLLYGLMPVFWWGAKDWSLAIPMVVTMATLQWLLFYIGAKRDAARKKEASQLERFGWPLGHACVLAGYFFVYHAIVVGSSA
jgi:hypothetical protein